MAGPTGVGKTEIARRLAKLLSAPFVLSLIHIYKAAQPPQLLLQQARSRIQPVAPQRIAAHELGKARQRMHLSLIHI